MPVQKPPIRLIATLSICIAMLFATGTSAAAQEKVLHAFDADGTDGYYPGAGLIFDAAGNLYGTTISGGSYNYGTAFELTPAAGGTWTEKLLHSFNQDGTDGNVPQAGLIFDAAGNLYGTTSAGGAYGYGAVFELTPGAGGTWTEKVLHSFGGEDGANPFGGLIFDAAGNLYGTTLSGGADNQGTAFELTPAAGGTWTEKVLYSFGGTDGDNPAAGLILDGADNLYGTASGGGAHGGGVVFELTPAAGGTWTENVLHSFGSGTDGRTPYSGLVLDGAGNLYGTTAFGGAFRGTLFELSPAGGGAWTETVLHNFGSGTDGEQPQAGLILDAADNLYGTTITGGSYGAGTVFRLNAQGEVLLQSFSGADGSEPYAGLVLDGAGNLYGTTSVGGTYGDGTVFEIAVPPPTPLQFVPLNQPCRAVDTRQSQGGGGPIQGGTSQNFAVSGDGACGVLPNAAVYSTNVTVVPSKGKLGYLTVWPAGQARPVASTLNSVDGRVKANAAIVPAGDSGQVSIYATDTTDVIVDVNGYFTPPTGSTLAFYPLTPCRVADTRNSTFPPGLGPPSLPANQERQFPILNATTKCNIPASGVVAYSLNFTVVPQGSLGFLTVWPTGQTRPMVSTLNDVLGRVIANAAIVAAGTSGEVSAYPTANTDLIIDINGYFAMPGSGGLSLYGVTPCRVLDTRHGGGGPPFEGTLNPPVDVLNSQCGVSSHALAYAFNATVIPAAPLGYLTLWPYGTTQPAVSTLNATDESITNNMAIVPAGTAGKVNAYASGLTQLLLDISSYFAP